MTSLYETDFNAWCESQAEALRMGIMKNLDKDNLIEEIKDLGASQKNAIKSYLKILMIHMIKMETQADYQHKVSWEITINNCRIHIEDLLAKNPGLKPSFDDFCDDVWKHARVKASVQMKKNLREVRKERFTKEEIQGED